MGDYYIYPILKEDSYYWAVIKHRKFKPFIVLYDGYGFYTDIFNDKNEFLSEHEIISEVVPPKIKQH